jgi:hypothetical protein
VSGITPALKIVNAARLAAEYRCDAGTEQHVIRLRTPLAFIEEIHMPALATRGVALGDTDGDGVLGCHAGQSSTAGMRQRLVH